MRALVIAHDEYSLPGTVGERLVERGIDLDVHIVCPDPHDPSVHRPFPEVGEHELVVPMGSVWSVYDHATIGNWIGAELALLRDAHHSGHPVLGICFGGQALAAALGGHVESAPEAEIGWCPVRTTRPDVVPDGPWFEWHHDHFTAPPGAEVIAENDAALQVFRIGHSVGTQFHPEVSEDHVRTWFEFATEEYLAAHGIDTEALLAETRRREVEARRQSDALVDWFLDEVSGLGARLA